MIWSEMSDTTPALDEAFERMAAASFELPNGFVNHGAMACEALAMLDCTSRPPATRPSRLRRKQSPACADQAGRGLH
jgi:hypothetical protein